MIGRRSHDDAQSFDDALTTGRAPRDAQIADLVRFAEGLCEAATVEPSPEFRASLRSQLMTEAATVLVPMPAEPRLAVSQPSPKRSGRSRVATVTAALVASAGVVGLVASSASAVPGEMLYPVKRSVENAELQLHRGDASRGAFQLNQASERLAEARRLTADGRSARLIADSLEDFSSAAAQGSSKLFTDYSASGTEKSIRRVNDFAATSSLDLSSLSANLPAGLATSFAAASDAVTELASEASSLCGSCDPADVRALVDAVAKEATTPKNTVAPTPASSSAKPSAPRPSAAKPARTAVPDATPATTPPPAAPISSPKPTTTPVAPSLGTITDPLVGGLLGGGDQTGLVPGLLNGLLGNNAAK